MSPISCKVESIEPLTDIVSRVKLAASSPVSFKAGQYVKVIMGENDSRPFSIANSPDGSNQIELHIGAGVGNDYAGQVLEKMKTKGEIDIAGGHGEAYLRDENIKPTILLAGGTGFSYTYSILQQRLKIADTQPVFLYWGTQTLADMYEYEALIELEKEHSNFRFIPVVDAPDEDWQGKSGWVHQAILADFVSLEPYQVYVAGRFEMAGVARDDFQKQGLLLENLFGDAYQFI
ncbi:MULTISPECIES: NAD(P)H-flavin reductase [Aliiglaciecola]|uniref:NAD(P)H-flavin reductase n=1 Tax=Aliiglaciecola TaxID=1406885 RepID=UPI001C0A5058|nr:MULTISPECIES: NAD(P)H-flavin reductase [Aliiglaciecola]MBU2879368.1 NAD(P)H-flavin reductase [Aliiglaciecola lipolytica]MDO6709819.1 NAD(P)H-flavin reductase [Aliiglaciecola sp. 2_MG-2023]MDO6750639.1 NAD(P)H-flavin reductase [Aliiglaciecola sp. 1_MG-2023]